MISQYSKAYADYQYVFDRWERNILRSLLHQELRSIKKKIIRDEAKQKPVEELQANVLNIQKMISELSKEYKI
jgi:hypothetical protein